jgi:tetratricopeptide (TPR) repeat protein
MGLPVVMAISLAKEEVYGDEVPAEHAEAAAAEDRRLRFLTWRTAGFAFVGMVAMWGVISTGWILLGVPSYLLFTGAAAGFVEERDCIVVAEFENETEDEALGLSVRTLVVTDIGQRAYVNVLGVEQLRETLELMRLPDSTRVDQHLALDIARRENCPAVVAGTVASLGTAYLLSARILNTATREEVVPLSEPAMNDSALYEPAQRLARQVRRHLGESLASIQRSEPLARVTTSSLEALKLYSEATGPFFQRLDMGGAIARLERAVELDPAFAMAYAVLGSAYGNAPGRGSPWRMKERAYQLRERLTLTHRERLKVIADYHWLVNFWFDSAAYYYERGLDLYPSPGKWSNNLAIVYYDMYRFEDALAVQLELLEGPDYWEGTSNELTKTARTLGRHGLADSVAATMRPGGDQLMEEAWNAYYAGDLVRVDSLARELEKLPVRQLVLAGEGLRAVVAAMYGRMDEALALAGDSWLRFIELAWFVAGTPERALPYINEARSRLTLGTRNPVIEYRDFGSVAWGYALAGDVQSARELLAVQDSLVEKNDFNPFGFREHVQAVIALQEGRAEDAVEHFRRAKAAYYGRHLWWDTRALLAEAHAELGNFDVAIAQYDTLTGTYRLHHWDRYKYLQLLPLAHERLGSLYLEVGDTVSAARHLSEFIELWRDADPELQPRVEAARRLLEQMAAEDG